MSGRQYRTRFRFRSAEGVLFVGTAPEAAAHIGCSYASAYAIASGRRYSAKGWICLGGEK
ncbi:MAG: hypothetical protein U1E34_10155 [Amaricoccus sp.]